MKLSNPKYMVAYLIAIAPIAVAGCSGALLGHLAVLALTLGIFVGTLQMGRARVEGGAAADATPTFPVQS